MKENKCIEETALVCGCETEDKYTDCEFYTENCFGRSGMKCVSKEARTSALIKKTMNEK